MALLLVAELLRNTGKYTMGDVLAFRMRQRPVRAAAATSTLAVSFFYLLAQMAGAGGLVALLLNVTSKAGQARRHRHRRRRDDRLRADRRHARHDLGADHQGGPAHRGRRDHDDLGARAVRLQPVGGARRRRRRGPAPTGEKLLAPGAQYGKNAITRIDFISLGLALVLGTAGLPHILMRFYTVPTARGGPPLGGLGDLP